LLISLADSSALPAWGATEDRIKGPEALFGLFVRRVLLAAAAVFAELQPLLQSFLVFVGVLGGLADRAFQLDHVVLGHSVV